LDQHPLILCLCQPEDHWKLIPGYVQAFRRVGYEFVFVGGPVPLDQSIEEILAMCPRRPEAVFHFESALPLLPEGLPRCDLPTFCFHADTYAYTDHRLRWSYLFDHAAVFHPGYEAAFREGGHPGAFLLPHAVRREFYDLPDSERIYEIGWVGQTGGPLYQNRSRLLSVLFQNFRANDWKKHFTLEEVASVYRRSQIVVNVGRDDFPHDANLRVFEVLASGALLITSLPTELTQLGFEEGVHFVGYSREEEVLSTVRHFLQNEPERLKITGAARTKTLQEHTYDARVSQLLLRLRSTSDRRQAPARSWSDARARLIALDFFAAHGVTDCAIHQYWALLKSDPSQAFTGSRLLAWALGKKFANSLHAPRR